jgi:6-phosphogluconolactonase
METDIYKPHVIDFETSKGLYDHLSSYIQDRIVDINGDQGIVRIAVSGGRSIVPLLEDLKDQGVLPWARVEIFQIDERYVPNTDPESNQKVLVDTLGESFCEDLGELNLFNTSLPIDIAVKNYQEVLDNLDGKFFDIVILGAGLDGHIASLFPFGDYLKHLDQGVISTTAPRDFAVAQRLSLTVESILNSEEIILVINGNEKSAVLQEILEGGKKATEFPVKFLLAHPSLKIYHSSDDK